MQGARALRSGVCLSTQAPQKRAATQQMSQKTSKQATQVAQDFSDVARRESFEKRSALECVAV